MISVSELQRLPFGDALILHDRMYPYVTHLPDISEYKFKEDPEVPGPDNTEMKDPEIVDLESLVLSIREGKFPRPFASETPAIDLFLKLNH